MKNHKILKSVLVLTLAVGVEGALLALAHWQFNRYHQRLNAIHAFNALPPATLTGTFGNAQTVALTNQPNPADADAPTGWRIFTPMQTASGTVVVDRGWSIPSANPQNGIPNFMPFATSATQITGVWQPFPVRHGWLKGPEITTSPRLLAFLNPALITSQTTAPRYFVARTATSPYIRPAPPPLPTPMRHLSYMWQWLGMAVAFPLLCLSALRKGKRRR